MTSSAEAEQIEAEQISKLEKEQAEKESQLKTWLSRYKNSGKAVSMDFFLFTCLEEETVHHCLKSSAKTLWAKSHWPKLHHVYLDDGFAEIPQKDLLPIRETELEELLKEALNWYKNSYPILTKSNILDYPTHADLLQPFMLMVEDIETLYLQKINQKPLFFKDKNEVNPEHKENWETLKEHIHQTFPTYSSYMLAYIEWAYSKRTVAEITLKQVAPVGRYSRILQRKIREYERNQTRRPERPPPSSRGHHNNSTHNHHSRNRPPFKDNNRREAPNPDGKRQREAMAELNKALGILRRRPELKEIQLRPQGNHIRKQQHRYINDSGFQSKSVGEGEQRAVKIVRF